MQGKLCVKFGCQFYDTFRTDFCLLTTYFLSQVGGCHPIVNSTETHPSQPLPSPHIHTHTHTPAPQTYIVIMKCLVW